MANLEKVIYINETDYSTLLNGGSITKGGTTYTYDSTALYVIKDVSAPEYAETAGYATTAGRATKATQDGSGNNIVQTYATKSEIPATGADIEYTQSGNEYYVSAGDTINQAITDLDTGLGEHGHGNINSKGQIVSDTVIANGDKLVVTDASSFNTIVRASLTFDGSTTTQALSKKGTWETFYQKPSTGIPETDLASAVQTSLGKADTSVQKITSTDNAIARFDGTSGNIQNSGVTIDDSNNIATSGDVKAKKIIVQGSNTTNETRYLSSDSATNMFVSIGGITPVVINTTEVRRSTASSAANMNLGSSSYPWNNAYAKKFITNGGTSSQFVKGDGSLDSTAYAPLASPALTGTPTAPTAAAGTNTTQIATTAFVQNALSNMGAGGSEMVDVTITGTTSSASFSANPYNAIKAVVDDGKIAVLNASVAPLSTTGVLIPVYEYTYSQSGTDYTGYKGKIQNGNYEIGVDVQSTSSATVSITSVGSSITVDTALSESSTNPVQNRVITAQILENEEIIATALNNLNDRVELKQDQLVSGTTIKTINNQSILGSGNITISGGSGGGGDVNVIESITFNGTAVPVDANKNAAITADVPFVVNISENNNVFTADKTFNEVVAALDAGKVIIGKWNVVGESDDSYGSIYSGVYVSQDEGYIHFVNTEGDYYDRFTLSYDNSITREDASLATQDFVTVRGVKVNNNIMPITNKYAEITLKTINSTSLVGSGNISVGTYSKPSGGIPATDLASDVQTSLGKADTALQSYTETDPVFTASAAHGITAQDISNWNAKQNSLANTQNPYTAQGTSTKVPTITTNNLGQVTTITETNIDFPTLSKGTTSGSGNAVTDISVSGHTITLTKGSTFGTYSKPSGGIPATDLATAVSQRLLPEASGSTDDGKIVQYSYIGGGWQLVKPITIYTGSTAPSSGTGSDGDIYIQTS